MSTTRVRKYLLGLLAASVVSISGLSLIAGSEGMRYTAYPDPATQAAPWTICRGHTGPEVHQGLTVSENQCDIWFAQDVARAETSVQALVEVPVKQGEYDSLVSFVFNLGPSQLRKSHLLYLLNTGHHYESCNEYPRWKYANGMVMEGLIVRRTKEQAQCHLPGRIIYVPHHK